MIHEITITAARRLATQDARRAMRSSEYEGVGFDAGEAYSDFRFEGLGDVLLLNPKARLSEDAVKAYDEAYDRAWHLA